MLRQARYLTANSLSFGQKYSTNVFKKATGTSRETHMRRMALASSPHLTSQQRLLASKSMRVYKNMSKEFLRINLKARIKTPCHAQEVKLNATSIRF